MVRRHVSDLVCVIIISKWRVLVRSDPGHVDKLVPYELREAVMESEAVISVASGLSSRKARMKRL